MKKLYEKPDVELVELEVKDSITETEGGNLGNLSGGEGMEEW